jgi:integrase
MHRTRHTFATELRRDVGDLGVVQRMLGHSDIHTTEAFYGQYDLTDLEPAGSVREAWPRQGSQLTTPQIRTIERYMGAPGIEPGTSRV